MLSEAMLKAINEQIHAEFESSYLYLAMSATCESMNLEGAAHWLQVQSREEWGHGMKLYGYVFSRGASVELKAIAQPALAGKSVLDVFLQVQAHEKKITAAIEKLMDQAVAEKDYATQSLLQWFIGEQVEEEKTAAAIIEQWKIVGDKGPGLIMMDRQLAARA